MENGISTDPIVWEKTERFATKVFTFKLGVVKYSSTKGNVMHLQNVERQFVYEPTLYVIPQSPEKFEVRCPKQ